MDVRDRQRIRVGLVVAGLLLAAAVVLFRVDVRSLFTLGVVLLCPLMMLGMHRGHGGGSTGGHHADHGPREEVDP